MWSCFRNGEMKKKKNLASLPTLFRREEREGEKKSGCNEHLTGRVRGAAEIAGWLSTLSTTYRDLSLQRWRSRVSPGGGRKWVGLMILWNAIKLPIPSPWFNCELSILNCSNSFLLNKGISLKCYRSPSFRYRNYVCTFVWIGNRAIFSFFSGVSFDF